MKLESVYESLAAPGMLYILLSERQPEQNISHGKMPTQAEHMAFYLSMPYVAWYLVRNEKGTIVGATYLTHKAEIGIHLFEQFKGQGYGPKAIQLLMEMHPHEQYLANINPQNESSIRMFEKLGFTHIQNTYCLRRQS